MPPDREGIVPPDEAERLRAVGRYEILDTPPDGAFDGIIRLAAPIFDVPIAIVSIVDHDRIWFKSHHGLEVIGEESERLSGVVGEILSGAQLDAGRVQLVRERFDPQAAAERAVEAARSHLPERLSLELVESPATEIESDASKVRQILAGLIDNAVKYSPGGGRIEVATEPRDGGIRFSVRDEGIGIAPDELERVFEKFVRLDGDETGGVGGTGLGLYIARELAQRLGGSLKCLSVPGAGSTFVLDLPVRLPGTQEQDGARRSR